ncbi:hypothetical protein [Comamonas sp.]|nr:hypothetical protein [Comamonas sp.]
MADQGGVGYIRALTDDASVLEGISVFVIWMGLSEPRYVQFFAR